MTATTRNHQIGQAYTNGQKCADLARHYGISRERIRQILRTLGLATPKQKAGTCRHCGKTTKNATQEWCSKTCRDKINRKNECLICGDKCYGTTCMKHSKVDPWDVNETVTLYRSGLTFAKIADQRNIHYITVMRHCHFAGIRPKPRR